MRYILLTLIIFSTLFNRTALLSYDRYEMHNVQTIKNNPLSEMTFLDQDDGIEHTISSNPFVGIFLSADPDSVNRILETDSSLILQTISISNLSQYKDRLRNLSEYESEMLHAQTRNRVQASSAKWDSCVLTYVIELRRIVV